MTRLEQTSHKVSAWAGTLSVIAAGIMLGLNYNAFSMWLDEVNVVLATLRWNPLDYATYGTAGHPPLYFMLLRGWIVLSGQDDLALRTFTFLTGLLAAAFVFRIGADFTRKASAGAIATLLFGSMGFVRYYVHETHNYALLLLFSVALLFFSARWWTRPTRIYGVGVVATLAGLIYTHYYSIYFIAALNIAALFLGWRNWARWRKWGFMHVFAGILYAPWMFRIFEVAMRILARRANPHPRAATAQGTNAKTIVDSVSTLLSDQQMLFGLLLAAAALGIWCVWRAQKPGTRRVITRLSLLLIVLVFSYGIALGVNRYYGSFSPRRIIYVLPVFSLLLACGLVTVSAKYRWPAVLAVVVVSYWYGWSPVQPGNWFFRQAVESVRDQLQPGDLVYLQATNSPLVADQSRPIIYYGQTLLPPDTVIVTLGEKSPLGSETGDVQFARSVFAPAVVTHRRFWVVSAIDSNVAPSTLDWVEQIGLWSYSPLRHTDFGALRVSLYERADVLISNHVPDWAVSPASVDLPQSFGDLFRLDQVRLSSTSLKPGNPLTIWLEWQALRRPDQDYAVFVHLLATPTQLLAQADNDPTYFGYPAPTSSWALFTPVYDEHVVTIPVDAPSGRYQLQVGLYSRIDGARLPIIGADGTIADSLLLADINIHSGN